MTGAFEAEEIDNFVRSGYEPKEWAVKKPRQFVPWIAMILLATPVLSSATHAQSSQEAPAYKITPVVSKIRFNVNAATPIEGTFEKWNATLAFTSTDPSTGSLDIKIQGQRQYRKQL